MKVAVIDIGTNTVLLLVAHIDPAGAIIPIVYEQRVPRLGRGVDERKKLAADSMDRVISVLFEYKSIIEEHGVRGAVVCGTSAVRDAANRREFADRVRRDTGFELEILSGEEEALLTHRGAMSGLPAIHQGTVLDIGGGSTEISTGTEMQLTRRVSLDIGSVRLTERLLKHDPPLQAEIDAATVLVHEACRAASSFPTAGSTLVAVAGTATSLAMLALHRKTFSMEHVAGTRLSFSQIDELFRMLSGMPSSGIRTLSDAMEGRSDVVTAGALILREVMMLLRFDQVVVSERGVRYGLAIRAWEKERPRL